MPSPRRPKPELVNQRGVRRQSSDPLPCWLRHSRCSARGGADDGRPHALARRPQPAFERHPERSQRGQNRQRQSRSDRRNLRLPRRAPRTALPGSAIRPERLPPAAARRVRRVDLEARRRAARALPAPGTASGHAGRAGVHRRGGEGRRQPRAAKVDRDHQLGRRRKMARRIRRGATRPAGGYPPRQRRTWPQARVGGRAGSRRGSPRGARCWNCQACPQRAMQAIGSPQAVRAPDCSNWQRQRRPFAQCRRSRTRRATATPRTTRAWYGASPARLSRPCCRSPRSMRSCCRGRSETGLRTPLTGHSVRPSIRRRRLSSRWAPSSAAASRSARSRTTTGPSFPTFGAPSWVARAP